MRLCGEADYNYYPVNTFIFHKHTSVGSFTHWKPLLLPLFLPPTLPLLPLSFSLQAQQQEFEDTEEHESGEECSGGGGDGEVEEDGGGMGLGEQEQSTEDDIQKSDYGNIHLDSVNSMEHGEPYEHTENSEHSDTESDGAVASSAGTVATTTSYLHGDKTTVRRLVARGLRKKQQQNRRRTRPRKEGSIGRRKNGTKNKGKSGPQWSLDMEW